MSQKKVGELPYTKLPLVEKEVAVGKCLPCFWKAAVESWIPSWIPSTTTKTDAIGFF